ncbi:hypothetical protein GmHk_15G042769 [Glycine max]|nr:hypothetical protein GmHk_15G042769 [Glycine max]
MQKFYQLRKSQRRLAVVVLGHQIPLYEGVLFLGNSKEHLDNVALPLNLTFVDGGTAWEIPSTASE